MSLEDVQSSELTVEEMFESVSQPEQEIAPEEPLQQETEPEYEYTALGATRKEPLSLILKRASQGYDYAQKMEQFKQEQAAIEQAKAQAEALNQKYAHIDQYAQENPEWYDHWSQAYEQRQTMGQQEGQPAIDLSPVKQEIDALKNEFSSVKEFITNQQQSQEDGKYWDEVRKVQKEFPDIDLNQSDETGKTLEYKILEHAKTNGIASFRVAFRDFYHDQLKTRMLEQAKQDLIREDKERRKKGIVGVSNTPILNTDMPDLRNMSENDILQAAIAEIEGME